MVADDYGPASGISVTFKYGKGYEEPWVVFKGSARKVREDLLEFFQLPAEAVAGLSLNAVLIQCNHIVHGTGNAATILGGVVVAETSGKTEAAPSQPAGSDPWAGVSKDSSAPQSAAQTAPTEPAENPHGGLISQIQAAETGDDLKRLWAGNKDAFSDPAVVEAYKVKGQSL